MIRDFALHPVQRSLEHVDFVEVKLDRPVDVAVPLIATGKAAGVAKGGVLRIVYRLVPVRCLPDRIPTKIETDVTHLELGEHITTQDLKLPEGVTVRLPAEQTLVAVVAPEKEVEETPRRGCSRGCGPGRGGSGSGGRGGSGGRREEGRQEGREEEVGGSAARRRPRQPRPRVREKPAQRRLPRGRCPARVRGLAGLQAEVQRRVDARARSPAALPSRC